MANNILTYILELQDKISPKLKAININNDKMLEKWSEVQVKMNAAKKCMSDTGNSIGSLNEKIAALRMQREWIPGSNTAAIRATNHEIQRLEKQVKRLESLDGGKFKKWTREIAGSIPALVNPLSVIGVGVVSSVKKGMENELQRQNITSLLAGDTAAADKLFGQISEYGKKTVYDKAGLIEAQKTMMSFGLSGEKSFNTLKQIGDIAMGDANKMQSLALAFSQATSAGKLQGQDLLQLINAGFNPLQVISEHTGKSMSHLKDEMGKGQISAEMLAQAFAWATEEGGLFYQGAEKAGQTMSGRINQLKDSFDELLIKAFGAIEPVLSPLVDFATNVIDILGNGLAATIDFVGSAVRNVWDVMKEIYPIIMGVATAVGILTIAMNAARISIMLQNAMLNILIAKEWLVATVTKIWTGIQAAFNAVMSLNPVVLITASIVVLIGAIVWVCSKITGWGSLWEGVMGFMKYSFYAFIDAIKLYFTTYINGFMMGLDKIKLGWYKFKEAMGLGDSAENQAAIEQINADVEARKKAITDAADAVADNAKKAKESLQGIEMGWKKGGKATSAADETGSKTGINSQLQASVNGGMANQTNNGGETASSSNAIATGGTRNTQITINLGKMADITFNGGVGENAENLKSQLEEILLRILYSAQNA